MSPSLTTQDTKAPRQPGFATEAPVSSGRPASYGLPNRQPIYLSTYLIYPSIRLSLNASTLAMADVHGTWAAKVMYSTSTRSLLISCCSFLSLASDLSSE